MMNENEKNLKKNGKQYKIQMGKPTQQELILCLSILCKFNYNNLLY